MLYINMFDVRMVCRIICKCYASLIFIQDRCQSFLHISHIHQKLPKPNRFLKQWLLVINSASVVDNAMNCCFLHFHEMISTPTKNTNPMMNRRSFVSPVQSASQKPSKIISFPPWHNLKSKWLSNTSWCVSRPSNELDRPLTWIGSPYSP